MTTIANNFAVTENLNPREGDILIVRCGDDQIKDTYYIYNRGAWNEYGLEVTTPHVEEPKVEEACDACAINYDDEPSPKPAPKKRTKKRE